MVMTQEYSKKFLQSEDPSDRYSLFFKATQLSQVHSDYQSTYADKADIEKLMARNRTRLEEQKKELDKKK